QERRRDAGQRRHRGRRMNSRAATALTPDTPATDGRAEPKPAKGARAGESWPMPTAYTIAVQNPQLCFRDPELGAAAAERTLVTRMPKVWTGNFAQVYELRTPGGRWAVKCFTRSIADIRARYSAIAAAIARSRLPYFVDFRFLDDEMLVDGTRW